jgi:hypothetical protein
MEESRPMPSRRSPGADPALDHDSLRFVEELEHRLRSLCGTLDANDADQLRDLVRTLFDSAHEQIDCDFIGIEDDGLFEEMEVSSVTERVEDIVAFCRAAVASKEPADAPEPGSDEA